MNMKNFIIALLGVIIICYHLTWMEAKHDAEQLQQKQGQQEKVLKVYCDVLPDGFLEAFYSASLSADSIRKELKARDDI